MKVNNANLGLLQSMRGLVEKTIGAGKTEGARPARGLQEILQKLDAQIAAAGKGPAERVDAKATASAQAGRAGTLGWDAGTAISFNEEVAVKVHGFTKWSDGSWSN